MGSLTSHPLDAGRWTVSGSTLRLRIIATVTGTVLATAAHLLALAVGVDMLVPAFEGEGTQQLATIGVAASAAGATLIGWAAAWAAARFTSRPRTVWAGLAVVGLALSFIPVVAIEATVATKIVLAVQHLLVAGAIIPLFARTLPTATPPAT
jgi:uncharacterized membrane protein